MAVHPLFLLHSHLLAISNAVFPLQTPASVMELVDVPDSMVRNGGKFATVLRVKKTHLHWGVTLKLSLKMLEKNIWQFACC